MHPKIRYGLKILMNNIVSYLRLTNTKPILFLDFDGTLTLNPASNLTVVFKKDARIFLSYVTSRFEVYWLSTSNTHYISENLNNLNVPEFVRNDIEYTSWSYLSKQEYLTLVNRLNISRRKIMFIDDDEFNTRDLSSNIICIKSNNEENDLTEIMFKLSGLNNKITS